MPLTLASRMSWPRRNPLRIGPVAAIFLSANLANLGNLVFNMLFSRWMGPQLFGELAVLLTLQLAVLSVLNAVQFAVSRDVARDRIPPSALARLGRLALLGGLAALPPAVGLLWYLRAVEALGLGNPVLLAILVAALPFATPLCLLRGAALGRVNARQVILSTQVEMLVRLGLGALAWKMGFGIEGVTIAIGLSLIAGWLVIAGEWPSAPDARPEVGRIAKALLIGALPFAILQAAQVILLDGEVILSRLWLGPEASGHAAALSLFQRIAFFACFGLAALLLPTVASAHARGTSLTRAVLPIAGLFLSVSLPLLLGALLLPETMIGLAVGPDFLPSAPLLWQATLAAILFTISYLVATGLVAIGDRRGIWLIALCVPVQIAAMIVTASGRDVGLGDLLTIKLLCQSLLCLALIVSLLRRMRRTVSPPACATG